MIRCTIVLPIFFADKRANKMLDAMAQKYGVILGCPETGQWISGSESVNQPAGYTEWRNVYAPRFMTNKR